MTYGSLDYRHAIHQKPFQKGDVRLTVANICSAFDERTIGTKFTSTAAAHAVVDLIEGFDFPENGQATIPAQDLVTKGFVRSGDAPIPEKLNPDDWHLLPYRGQMNKYLASRFAEKVPVKSCTIYVYTKDAYMVDPDVVGDEEAGIPRDDFECIRFKHLDCTHVLVGVFASGTDRPSTVSPFRFVANLAGGNKDYEAMAKDDLVALAQKVRDNSGTNWAKVADRY